MTRATMGKLVALAALGATLVTTAGCGDLARTGRSPAFLIMDSLTAESGADPGTFSSVLLSDVQTYVEVRVDGQTVRVPTFFNDFGAASIRLSLKNPGTTDSPTSPSTINQITINRYRVTFTRTDGRNTPGVDVPFGFDGAVTATVAGTAGTEVAFQIVSHAMKLEQPLIGLRRPDGFSAGGQVFIHTLAEVTFYGRDQAGNEVSVSGLISVNFGDFADPD